MASWDAVTTSLSTELAKPETALALPSGFNKERFTQNAVAFLKSADRNVTECGLPQVMSVLKQGAILGLDFMSKECYAVPYGGKLQFMKSPTGDIKLVKKYAIRPVREVDAKVVREGDTFELTYNNDEPSWVFKPKPFSGGEVVGAFAWVRFEDGGILLDTLDRSELDAARSKSKMANTGAWKSFPTEMFRKVALHRVCKKVAIDFENPMQRQLFDADTEITDDAKELRDKDIVEEANARPFGEVE